ncbi:MAG TPA: transporter substrate-binding domain-containing protein [Terracidiphilus sp.]|nr:transporter substrate-binding domain-containing protein [Terracidiphilus sp.]
MLHRDNLSCRKKALTWPAIAALTLLLVASTAALASDPTLAHIRAANVLRCGIDAEQAEYSTSDNHGNRAVFDADLCRAVAVAVLGKNAQVAAKQYPDDDAAMAALTAGEVDLVPTLTDDFSHAAGTHIAFTRPVLWDGVGFLIPAASPVTRARQLSGKKVCFLAETAVEESVRSWFAREHLDFVPFPFQEEGEMQAALATGNCAALAGDRTRLAQTRAALALRGKRTRLVPETISKDPLAAAVRDNDPEWQTIVNWVMEALVQSEELGVTQANVRALQGRAAQDSEPLGRFLLGGSHQIGSALGLDDDWVARMIEATGNYGEIYQRDLGSGSPMKLPRGDNKLYRNGGAMLALPPR